MVTLGDVCAKGSSNIAQKDLEGNTGVYPIFGASGLIKCVDFYKQEKEYIAIVKDGAGVGRTMILPAYSSVIGTMQYIFPKENIDVKFLYYVLTWMNLSKYYTGATIPHIYFKDYKKEQFNLPSLEKQRHIVTILDKVSVLIENRKKQLKNLDELVKARFVEMFGFENYPVVKAKDVCDFITKGTTPPTGEITDKYEIGKVPYLKVYNLSFSGELLFDSAPQFIPVETHNKQLSRSKVFPNDVLMNIVGPPLGKFSLVTNEFEEWNINQAIAIFRAKGNVLPRYLMAALMQPEVLRPFLEQAVGIRQLNLSLEQCRNLEFPLPPLEKQKAFVMFAEQVDKSKFAVQQSLDKLETLKKSLMQKYFG